MDVPVVYAMVANNTLSRRRTYRKIAGIAFIILLLLFIPATASAADGKAVHVAYIYSPLCSICEHSGPAIRKAVESSRDAGLSIQYEELAFSSREGMGYMQRFGLDSVPAVVIDDRVIRFEDFNGDTEKLGRLIKEGIADASNYVMPVALERRIYRPEGDRVRVVTCISNAGQEPVEAEIKNGLCDGVNVVSGDAAWHGIVGPGERQYVAYEADVQGSVNSLPPQTLTYRDSHGDHIIVGYETPVFLLKKLSIGAVFIAGLVAGINPCLIAIMAFVSAMALSAKGGRLGVMLNLLSFCGGLLSIYLLMGIGFLRLIEYTPSIAVAMKMAIILLLVVLGIWAFYDAYRTKVAGDRPSLFKSFLDQYKPLYRRFSLAANFGLGGAFGLIKMPCIGGIYVGILGAIVEAGEVKSGLPYLAAYNLGIVMPVLALGALLTLGLSPVKVDDFRRRHRVMLKLVSGLILLAMAGGFILNII
jgi:cytochrome c biogenesis protein CcdA